MVIIASVISVVVNLPSLVGNIMNFFTYEEYMGIASLFQVLFISDMLSTVVTTFFYFALIVLAISNSKGGSRYE